MTTLYKDADLQVLGSELQKTVTLAEASKEVLGKRVHDLVSAVRVVRFGVEALQAGQTFSGKDGEAKLKSLERAIGTLEKELPWIESVLSPSRA